MKPLSSSSFAMYFVADKNAVNKVRHRISEARGEERSKKQIIAFKKLSKLLSKILDGQLSPKS